MTKFFIFQFYLSFIVFRETQGLELSSLITPCSAKDPKLNECVKKTGQKFIPMIAHGVSEWNIPAIDPVLTPERSFNNNRNDNSLVIKYTNILQSGFSSIIIENADIDLSQGIMTFKLKYPHVSFVADYAASGRFYNFDVEGNGKANITVWNSFSSFVLKYHLIDDHIKHDSITIGLSFDKIYLDYSNIMLNGDHELSKSAGTFLNENSLEVIEGFKPELEKFYEKLTQEFLQPFFDAVPYSTLFKDV